ncbi:hypothetical protein [Vibrio phage JSF12]|uniref:Uncharacterized protein n=2 Tax=Jesfedecavirus TaxID=2560156 RepID=A0A2D0YLW7_9CAUD|nr:hypothetical protein FDI98_gp073 [Vibrio phage JSF10]YP_009794805.1 hypothetical protein HOS35_gp122 [Vibrio phage JSF12]ASV43459.1 hypothetical protein [Vibrio phage JSF10]ASV43640.1 hypothetical protein [Vibrio phage JSF12]
MGQMMIKVSGVWKKVNKPLIKVGGVWKPAKAVWIKVNGVWKQTFVASIFKTGPVTARFQFYQAPGNYRSLQTYNINQNGMFAAPTAWGAGNNMALNSIISESTGLTSVSISVGSAKAGFGGFATEAAVRIALMNEWNEGKVGLNITGPGGTYRIDNTNSECVYSGSTIVFKPNPRAAGDYWDKLTRGVASGTQFNMTVELV